MSNKHLSTQPYTLVKDDDNDLRTWMYEEGGGLCVVHEVWINGVYNRTDQIKIPWRKIRQALARKDREEPS